MLHALTIGEIQQRDPEPYSTSPKVKMPQVPDGCEYSESCFTCPLSKCRYEASSRAPVSPQTMKRIVEIRKRDLDVEQIRQIWPMSQRNAIRLINMARDRDI